MKELLLYLEPNYQPPSHTTLMRHINTTYDEDLSQLKQKVETDGLTSSTLVSITTDCWTNRQMSAFMTITAHWIDRSWQLRNANFGSPLLTQQHTGDNLAETIDETLSPFKVNAFCTTHDNASNMKKALDLSSSTKYHIGCLAHLLQLSINDSFEEVDEVKKLINKVHTAISTVHRSITLTSEFRTYRAQLCRDHDKCELQKHNKTRWNSTVVMLQSFSKLFDAFDFLVKSTPVLNNVEKCSLSFGSHEIIAIKEMIVLLEDLKMTTDEWQTETSVSVSEVYPIMFCLLKRLQLKPCETAMAKEFQSRLLINLAERFSVEDQEFLGSMSVHVMGSFLDPRFKKLTFLSRETRLNVHATILDEMKKISVNVDEEVTEVERDDTSGAPSSKRCKLLTLLDDDVIEEKVSKEEDELDSYIQVSSKNA